MICVSRAPIQKLLGYRERMGWSLNWAPSYESDSTTPSSTLEHGTSASRASAAQRRSASSASITLAAIGAAIVPP